MHRSIPFILAIASSTCALSAPASAQCDIYRLDIPDFDQRREAAPGILGLPDNGSVHCGPTSAMNWLAYITNHGYPEVLSGARDWQSNSHYNTVTSLINWLGTIMNTTTGTTASNQTIGLDDWLDMTSPGNFALSLAQASGSYAPSPEDIYDLMTSGSLVTLCTSGWKLEPATPLAPLPGGGVGNLPERLVRQGGGHCVSVARVTDGCSNQPHVWFRDPAGFDGPDRTSQAQFVTQYLPVLPTTGWYAADADDQPIFRTMYRMYNGNDSKFSMINSLVSIMPLGALSADAQQGTISVMNLHSSRDFSVLPDTGTTHNTPGNAPIIGVRYLPHLGAAAVLTSSSFGRGTLYRFRPGTGEFKPLATIDSPGDMTVGLSGEIYVASRGHSSGVNVCLADGSVRFISTGVYRPLALAYDDANRRVVMILDNQHGTHVVGTIGAMGNDGGTFTNDYSLTISPLATGGELASVGALVIDPSNPTFSGGVYVASSDLNGIAPIVQTPNGWSIDRTKIIAIPNARNIQIDRRGRLYCTSNGIAHKFTLTFSGQTTTPVLDPNYKFAGRAVGDIFQVTVGRVGDERDTLVPSNHRPIDDPSSFPTAPRACEADINASGEVSVQDIFDYLASYFAGSPEADFNNSGTLTVQDLFDFLAAYFRGC